MSGLSQIPPRERRAGPDPRLVGGSPLREDVALANRIAHATGMVTAFGHVSARIPGTDTFLIPRRQSPMLATAATLLTVDLDGRVVDGDGTPNSELWIHARIYAARPDVGSVVHAHPLACIALTQIGQPHRVVHNSAGVFGEGVPEYERIGLIRSRELGDDLARSLGGSAAVMMRVPGFVRRICGARPPRTGV